MSTMSEKANDQEEIESLLPWHAAGTLSRRDAERAAPAEPMAVVALTGDAASEEQADG